MSSPLILYKSFKKMNRITRVLTATINSKLKEWPPCGKLENSFFLHFSIKKGFILTKLKERRLNIKYLVIKIHRHYIIIVIPPPFNAIVQKPKNNCRPLLKNS